MLNKKQHKACFKRTFNELAAQVWNLRRERQMTIVELSIDSKVPVRFLETLEIKGYPLALGELASLASFYDKRIKVELVDVEEDIKSMA